MNEEIKQLGNVSIVNPIKKQLIKIDVRHVYFQLDAVHSLMLGAVSRLSLIIYIVN